MKLHNICSRKSEMYIAAHMVEMKVRIKYYSLYYDIDTTLAPLSLAHTSVSVISCLTGDCVGPL